MGDFKRKMVETDLIIAIAVPICFGLACLIVWLLPRTPSDGA